MSEAAARVRAAIKAGTAPARRDLEHALRETLGLSARMAKRFCAVGAAALGEAEADAAELLDEVRGLLARLDVPAQTCAARPPLDTCDAEHIAVPPAAPACETHDDAQSDTAEVLGALNPSARGTSRIETT